jgi:hypothetical protein
VKSPSREVDRYNHVEGLAKIAQAEGAEAAYRRARDLEGLRLAVADKLTQQRDFVIWWDNHRLKGRPQKASGAADTLRAGQDGIPSRDTLHRWRKLKNPKEFESHFEGAIETCRHVCEMEYVPVSREGGSKAAEGSKAQKKKSKIAAATTTASTTEAGEELPISGNVGNDTEEGDSSEEMWK